jgi:hypothetical protein
MRLIAKDIAAERQSSIAWSRRTMIVGWITRKPPNGTGYATKRWMGKVARGNGRSIL